MRKLLPSAMIILLSLPVIIQAQVRNQPPVAASRPRTISSAPSRGNEAPRETPAFPASRGDTQPVVTEETPNDYRSAGHTGQMTRMEPLFPAGTSQRLLQAIENKMGVPYRYFGTDDSGYDCSGFVWRVFQEAGLDFERSSARSYWTGFPEASEPEKRMFGTLVFFNDLGHVGIVRDAGSFYHASTTQGVTLSSLTGYWAGRITGFRRIPFAQLADELNPAERVELKQTERVAQPEIARPAEPVAQRPTEQIQPEPVSQSKGKKGKAQPRQEITDRP